MLIKALAEYYDCLCAQKDSGLVPDGYSRINANYNIVLTKDGDLKEILDYRIETVVGEKLKMVERETIFPFRNSVSGISSETIEHRGKYLLGIDWDKENAELIVNKNSLLAFEKCKELNMEFLKDLSSPLIDAYKQFLMKWNPSQETENTAIVNLGKLYDTAKFVISLDDEINIILNDERLIKEKWDMFRSSKTTQSNAVLGQCSICGKVLPIARIHNNLSGVMGGLGTGVNIVCFKNSAFWSYEKKESYNSNVSEEVMEKYTKAFNFLTSTKKHKQLLDDMTILFWAQTKDNEEPYIDCFNWNCFSQKSELEDRTERESELASIFEQLAEGKEANWQNLNINENTDFYILGIKPNSSRLAIKLFEKNSFGSIMKNISKHHIDMQLDSGDKQLSIWQMEKELKSPVSKENINPELSTKILKSILTGCPYPRYMLETVVRRAKVDQDNKTTRFNSVNKTRVRIIKACLTRQNLNREGEFNMLNETSTDSSYNCGRLFAILEKIQCDVLGDINATIKDKFFSSACSTPYLIFPRLLKLSQSHLAKFEKPSLIFWENKLQEVMSKLSDNFPKAQSIEKQGIFILGYYQQKQKFYEKKENKGENV